MNAMSDDEKIAALLKLTGAVSWATKCAVVGPRRSESKSNRDEVTAIKNVLTIMLSRMPTDDEIRLARCG